MCPDLLLSSLSNSNHVSDCQGQPVAIALVLSHSTSCCLCSSFDILRDLASAPRAILQLLLASAGRGQLARSMSMAPEYSALSAEAVSSASDRRSGPSRYPSDMRPTPRPPAFAIPDPFAPLNRGDADADDLSSASSDSGGVQDYGDDDEEEQGEKQRLVQEGEMLDPEGRMWEDRKTAQAMFKSVLSDSEESLSKRQETDRISCGEQRRRLLLCAVSAFLLFLLFSGLLLSHLLSPSTGRHTFRGEGLKTITREHLANGTFWTEEVQLDWLAEGALTGFPPLFPCTVAHPLSLAAGDGVYSQRAEDGSILLTDINKNETRLLVDGNNIRDVRLSWSIQSARSHSTVYWSS